MVIQLDYSAMLKGGEKVGKGGGKGGGKGPGGKPSTTGNESGKGRDNNPPRKGK